MSASVSTVQHLEDCPDAITDACPACIEEAEAFRAQDDVARELDRRERIATAVLAAFAQKHGPTIPKSYGVAYGQMSVEESGQHASKEAVVWADALIAELDKEKP